jgi:hypothetical protein
MRRVLFLTVCTLFLAAGLAQADYTATLQLGGNYNTGIALDVGGNYWPTESTGGPISPSYLNGSLLPYVYCVGLVTNVIVSATYSATNVNATGQVYDNGLGSPTSLNPVPNAGQVAWLLSNYAAGATTWNQQVALQVAIWNVISGGPSGTYDGAYDVGGIVSLDRSSTAYSTYIDYLNALGSNTGNVSSFYWMTPGNVDSSNDVSWSQGLVAPEVPIPSAILLLGPGLAGIAALRRRFTK